MKRAYTRCIVVAIGAQPRLYCWGDSGFVHEEVLPSRANQVVWGVNCGIRDSKTPRTFLKFTLVCAFLPRELC